METSSIREYPWDNMSVLDEHARVYRGYVEGQRPCVLVVDDTAANRVLVRGVLSSSYDVAEADSVDAAMELLSRSHVDLVLLDVMMPGTDGFQGCRAIKARFGRPFLPVILVTGLWDQDDRNRGFEHGCDDFVTKPFDFRELALRVDTFVRIRKHEETIRRQLDELRRLDRLKDDLASLLVHDLRNPLAGIDGMLHLLYEEPGGDRELVGHALEASRTLRDTLEDMLRVRRLEDAQFPLQREWSSVRRIADEAAASQEPAARLHGVELRVDGDADEACVDAGLVRRTVENLLVNAIRYSRAGGEVSVVVRRRPGAVELVVADRGPGIPAALKDELFRKFGSVEARRGQARRGTGLGLYLARLVADAHAGVIAARDRAGGGTEFVLTLPLDQGHVGYVQAACS